MVKGQSSRDVIRRLESAGWRLVRTTGSHHHFRHDSRPGTVTVAHPVKGHADWNAQEHRAAERRQVEVGTMQQFYVAIIEKARRGYGVFFPDLPGCTTFGATVSEAAKNAYVAAQAHAALTQEYGERLPDARSPDQIASNPEVKEQARLLVPIEVGEEPVRVNISLPASALEALDRTARELSLTRSGAIAHLALARDAASGRFVQREKNRQKRKPSGQRIKFVKRK